MKIFLYFQIRLIIPRIHLTGLFSFICCVGFFILTILLWIQNGIYDYDLALYARFFWLRFFLFRINRIKFFFHFHWVWFRRFSIEKIVFSWNRFLMSYGYNRMNFSNWEYIKTICQFAHFFLILKWARFSVCRIFDSWGLTDCNHYAGESKPYLLFWNLKVCVVNRILFFVLFVRNWSHFSFLFEVYFFFDFCYLVFVFGLQFRFIVIQQIDCVQYSKFI